MLACLFPHWSLDDYFKRKRLSYIVNRYLRAKLAASSGATHSGEQEGENQPFRGWKGKGIPHLRT